MSSTSSGGTSSGGIGLGSLLTVLFVGLKLTHVIDWSWWWVLSPLWIVAGVTVVVLAVTVLILAAVDK